MQRSAAAAAALSARLFEFFLCSFFCLFAGHVESLLYQFCVLSRHVVTLRLDEHPTNVE